MATTVPYSSTAPSDHFTRSPAQPCKVGTRIESDYIFRIPPKPINRLQKQTSTGYSSRFFLFPYPAQDSRPLGGPTFISHPSLPRSYLQGGNFLILGTSCQGEPAWMDGADLAALTKTGEQLCVLLFAFHITKDDVSDSLDLSRFMLKVILLFSRICEYSVDLKSWATVHSFL
jgi:hypothetical protein